MSSATSELKIDKNNNNTLRVEITQISTYYILHELLCTLIRSKRYSSTDQLRHSCHRGSHSLHKRLLEMDKLSHRTALHN